MIIEVAKNIFWNTDIQNQSDEAYKWFRENITDKMAYSKKFDSSYVQPTYDKSLRPIKWKFFFDNFIVVVEKMYINENTSSWASKGEKVEFIKK